MRRKSAIETARQLPRGVIRDALLDAASSLMREQASVEIGILDIAAHARVNHGMIRY